jgi:hypothetical protein
MAKRKRATVDQTGCAHRALSSTFYDSYSSTKEPLIQIDYNVSSWQELGTQALFAGLAGMFLSVVIYLGVYYI